METIDRLGEEHATIDSVLDQFQRAVKAVEHGRHVPQEIFTHILDLLNVYMQRKHAGNLEAEIFPRLRLHGMVYPVERLENDYAAHHKLADLYKEAVNAYHPGDPYAGLCLATTARAYMQFIRRQLDREMEELFPVIQSILAAEDQAIVEGFTRGELQRCDPQTRAKMQQTIYELAARIEPWNVEQPHPQKIATAS